MKCYKVGVHLKYSIYLQKSLFRGGGETPNYVISDLNHPMDVCVQIIRILWRWPVAPTKCTLNLATLQSSRMAQRVFTKAQTFLLNTNTVCYNVTARPFYMCHRK